jgi:ferrous-iron efflux pump FieF
MRAAAAARAALASRRRRAAPLGSKGGAVVVTASVAMLGSLFDSALDLIASLVTLWAVRIAAAPADHDHRFRPRQGGGARRLVPGRLIASRR